ncbi:TonB-dependent receptor [Exilibacterium tricleocarpae]|uniref:TonB-dependent receptor n=1 Tax=Exilibacterium tricleocarpae TaxID=2591008 RepID=A0A545TQB9_9GAMM|nr:TonB-dependent receptor [Exilibacterium tricleocarpae]TQV79416.1 TonB-dependent receptor [Exilibacterium tricleocarpae]
MNVKNPLSLAISAVLVGASTLTLPVTAQTDAGEEGESIEEVIVTGSRIRSTVSDSTRPVTVIGGLDIEVTGVKSVAEVLRNTAFNSFGSYREQSGSSFGQIALANLRGLGEDRTAVLINGRRVPGNPLTGTSAVDLNSIPMVGLDRIEILTDSASAVYGADAIGGVINIIYDDDFEGAEFEIGTEEPTRDGGDSDSFKFAFGASGDKTSILFAGEWLKRNPIFDADRDYSRASVRPGPGGGLPRHAIDTVGVSDGGNTGYTLNRDEAFQVSSCDSSVYVPIANPRGIDGEGCGYAFANLSMQTGGIERASTYLKGTYEIDEDHELYIENRYSRIESFGRFAPAVGFIRVSAANPLNPRGDDAMGGPGLGEDIDVAHRFVGHGNRDDAFNSNEYDTIVGIKGEINNTDINYDFYARHYEYVSQNEGDTYVLSSVLTQLIDAGQYDFRNPLSQDPDHLAAVALSSATLFRDISTENTSAGLSLDGAFEGFGTGQIGWASGFEVASETYKDQYDSFREANNVIGSAGNTASGSRSRWAAFAEVEVPLFTGFSTNIAVRYDDYDDFGSEASPQIAFRYQPNDVVTLRASWGEGFKAPNLTDLGSSLASSNENVTDLRRCRAQGIPDSACPTAQVEEYTGGNPELDAETTESWNFGVIVNPTDTLTLSLDWFSIDIEDSIDSLDLQDVLTFEGEGTLPAGVIVNRGNSTGGIPGAITACSGGVTPPDCGIINVFANLATEEIEGIDLRAQFDLSTDIGNWMAAIEHSHILTYDYQPTPIAEVIDRPGTERYPEFRSNVTLRWSMDQWIVNYVYRYIASFDGASEGSEYPAWDGMDIGAIWQTPWGGDLSFGIRNLTDEDPSINDTAGYNSEIVLDIYDVAGRVPYISYRHTF